MGTTISCDAGNEACRRGGCCGRPCRNSCAEQVLQEYEPGLNPEEMSPKGVPTSFGHAPTGGVASAPGQEPSTEAIQTRRSSGRMNRGVVRADRRATAANQDGKRSHEVGSTTTGGRSSTPTRQMQTGGKDATASEVSGESGNSVVARGTFDGRPSNRHSKDEPFLIEVDRTNGDLLGIDIMGVDAESGTPAFLHIVGIREGLIENWNVQNPDLSVCKGDKFTKVNALSEDVDAMTEECKRHKRLTITVVHA